LRIERKNMVSKIRSLSQGFKKTPIVKIPEDWKVVKLGNISALRNNIVKPERKGVIKFVGLEHIDPGKTKIRDYYSDLNIKSSKFQFYAGDILYGKLRPYLDKAVIIEFNGICSTDLIVINSNRFMTLQKYLIYLFHSKGFINYAISNTSGTNHPRTSWKAIANFKFGLPPLPEQQKIAEILSTVDKAIEKVDEAIKKTQKLKKGIMQELLNKGIGHKEFNDSEIGRIPKEWGVYKLGDISIEVHRYPTYYNINYVTEGVREIRGQLIKKSGALETDLAKYRCISQETSRRFPRTIVKKGDFVMSVRGTMGKIAIIPDIFEGSNITANLMRISLNQIKCYSNFYKYVFLSAKFQEELNLLSSQTTIKTIQAPKLKSIKLPLPPITEQQKIAEILSTVDSRLEILRKRKGKLERVKKGLMNDLLTGRKRVRLDS